MLVQRVGVAGVIAEGVESEAQAEFLRDSGCDSLQGFLFSTPLSGDDVLKYLDEIADENERRYRAS